MIPPDLRAALVELEQDDPFAVRRYRLDPAYRAYVHEYVRRTRTTPTNFRDLDAAIRAEVRQIVRKVEQETEH
jgi:hypothetical protein